MSVWEFLILESLMWFGVFGFSALLWWIMEALTECELREARVREMQEVAGRVEREQIRRALREMDRRVREGRARMPRQEYGA